MKKKVLAATATASLYLFLADVMTMKVCEVAKTLVGRYHELLRILGLA